MKKSRRILLTPLEKYLQCNIEEATQISEHISAAFKNALKKGVLLEPNSNNFGNKEYTKYIV